MMQRSLARKLRGLRAQHGYTLVEAASKTGVDRGTLSSLERGVHMPYTPTLAKIAQGYGIPVEELLEEPVAAPLAEAGEGGAGGASGSSLAESPETRTLTEFIQTVKRRSLEFIRRDDIANHGKVAEAIDKLHTDLFAQGYKVYHRKKMEGDPEEVIKPLGDALEALMASSLEAQGIAAARDPENIDKDVLAKRRTPPQQDREALRRSDAG